MTSQTKRDRIVALVHLKDELATELQQLRERERAVDAELDALIGGHSEPVVAVAKQSPPPAKPKAAKAKAKAKKKAKPTVQPTAPAEPTPVAKTKPAAKPKAAAPKPKPKAKAKVAANAKPKTEGPTIKEKILTALKESAEGLDVAAIAKRAYGSEAKDSVRMCQANLYNMQKQKLVAHEGPIWRVETGASA